MAEMHVVLLYNHAAAPGRGVGGGEELFKESLVMGMVSMLEPYLACSLIQSGLGFLIVDTSLLKLFHGIREQSLVKISSLLGISCTSHMQESAVQELHNMGMQCATSREA